MGQTPAHDGEWQPSLWMNELWAGKPKVPHNITIHDALQGAIQCGCMFVEQVQMWGHHVIAAEQSHVGGGLVQPTQVLIDPQPHRCRVVRLDHGEHLIQNTHGHRNRMPVGGGEVG